MDNYKLAVETVSKRFDKEDIYYSVFVLCLYGLLNVFDDYKDIVLDIFLKVNILIDNKKIIDILNDNEFNTSTYFGLADDNDDFMTCGISSNGINYEFDGEKFLLDEDVSFIAISLIDMDINHLLLAIIHELAHLVKGYTNVTYTYKNDTETGYYLRSGVNIFNCSYDYNKKEVYYRNSYNLLDEVINCQHTTEAANYILELEGFIPEGEVLELFNVLDKDIFKTDFGYSNFNNLFSNLWKNDVFREIINKNIIIGFIDEIKDDYEEIMGENSFLELNDLLEIYDKLLSEDDDEKGIKEIEERFENLIFTFNEKVKEVKYIKC